MFAVIEASLGLYIQGLAPPAPTLFDLKSLNHPQLHTPQGKMKIVSSGYVLHINKKSVQNWAWLSGRRHAEPAETPASDHSMGVVGKGITNLTLRDVVSRGVNAGICILALNQWQILFVA